MPVSKILTKEDILRAQSQTRSNMHAARVLHVSYEHYKKYAKMYKNEDGVSLLEAHKNQAGKGIKKYSAKTFISSFLSFKFGIAKETIFSL